MTISLSDMEGFLGVHFNESEICFIFDSEDNSEKFFRQVECLHGYSVVIGCFDGYCNSVVLTPV